MLALLAFTAMSTSTQRHAQWTPEQAQAWYARHDWIVGCNFTPSTAVNQLEFWQADTFDLPTIDRELGYAESIGMNAVRAYLHDIAYEEDPAGFKHRMGEFLNVAAKHHIQPIFVFFDDCWSPEPRPGHQPAPLKGVHNSGWVRSPADSKRHWPVDEPRLKKYVTDVLQTFQSDKRVLMWDLYNEPGNSGYGDKSMHLLKLTYQWAWAVRPTQPVTSGIWADLTDYNKYQLANSDVVTFHNYNDAANLKAEIDKLKVLGRPLVCTEWMARTAGSKVETNLPVFHDEKVGCLNWGLVAGKTNTIFPWGSKEGSPEPELWFHDLFHADGTPYNSAETDLFKRLTGKVVSSGSG